MIMFTFLSYSFWVHSEKSVFFSASRLKYSPAGSQQVWNDLKSRKERTKKKMWHYSRICNRDVLNPLQCANYTLSSFWSLTKKPHPKISQLKARNRKSSPVARITCWQLMFLQTTDSFTFTASTKHVTSRSHCEFMIRVSYWRSDEDGEFTRGRRSRGLTFVSRRILDVLKETVRQIPAVFNELMWIKQLIIIF